MYEYPFYIEKKTIACKFEKQKNIYKMEYLILKSNNECCPYRKITSFRN